MFKNIFIKLDRDDFEYDTASLVKSFCANCNVSLETPGRNVGNVGDVGNVARESGNLIIDIHFDECNISIKASVTDGGNESPVYSIAEEADLNNRKLVKNILKRMIYDAMKGITGKELPWGTLTGIRPAKIAMSLIENGSMSDDDIYGYMKKNYYVSDKKIDLAIRIAEYEKNILESMDYKDGYSLYIGIPFCPTTCLYCSFTSFPISRYEKMADTYIEALCKEIDCISKKCAGRKLNTVYVGGGTPTTLSPSRLDYLLGKVRQSFDFGTVSEFTVEAGRPDSISGDKLEVLKKHGVVRISINPQTMKQETLDLIGRRHTVEDVKNAFYMAREHGFDNINMDLIAGLPDENADDVRNTLEEIKKLSPDSLTIHSLALKRASVLNINKDRYTTVTMENNDEIMDMVEMYASELEMKPYYMYRQKNMAGNLENVGYARLDKAGIYNILIMEDRQDIIALGAGAISKFIFPGLSGTGEAQRIERSANVKNIEQYIERIDEMILRKEKFLYGKE